MCAEMMDVSRDEAKRILRRLELEAYSSIISAFRAQGELSRAKKKILQDLGTQLSISTERHRAEVRRAYSDDRLGIVAESIYGAGSCAEWAAEGRRLVPLMPRLVPQTVFSSSATAAANSAAAANAKLPVSSANKAGSSSSASVNTSSSLTSQQNSKTTAAVKQPQTGGTPSNDADAYDDDDGKPKRKRRLSVTSLNKPVTKVTIPTPSLVSKAFTKQTTSVSTMTKSGKSLGPAGTIKAVPRTTNLPASAAQVKLLTKTVAVSQTKTILSYKAMTSTTSSPAKVQTAVTQSSPKTQTKTASGVPPKTVLTSKAPLSTAVKNVSTGASSPVATASPAGLTLKTGLTAAQLAARHKVKPAAARFKPLPGTVKFKSVTPATMGTCSTVTMVTPSPSSQASSTLPVSNTQPVVRVIHVPGTGGVGGSKPVVVMTTGLSKTTVAGVVPGSSSPSSLTKATSQVVTQSTSVNKAVVTTAGTVTSQAPSKTQVSSAVTQSVSSASKTVVMTTLVGGAKRVVLSVPAPLQPGSNIVPSTSSQGLVITKTQGIPLTSSSASHSQPVSKKDAKTSPALATVCPKSSPTQIAPSLTTATVTTQVRSRPLPTILPAPPKPSTVAPTAVSNSGNIRKLPTILPAPVKNVPAVIPTVLVPVATGVTAHTASQLQSSVPIAVNTAVSQGVAASVLPPDKEGEQPSPGVPERQDCGLDSTDQSNATIESQCSDIMENSKTHVAVSSKLAVTNEKNVVTECDNNTSSEDDSLLICSETIDNAGCNIPEVPSAAEFFKNIAESTPVKNPADNGAEEMPQTVEDCQEAAVDPVSLQDGGVSLLDIDGSNVQKVPTKDIETAGNYAKKSMENVTVQRLDDSSGISDLVKDCLPGNIYSESSQVDNEDENSLKFDLESDVQSSLQGVQENDQNVTGTSAEDGPPVENALQIIASFVESMEGSSFEKHEEVKHTTTNDHQLDDSSGFLSELPSSSQETPILVPSAFTLEEKTKDATEPSPTVSHSGKIIDEGQSLSVLSQSEDDSWDVSDAPIDVLSTSTSSSNSIPESTLELTEKEMKALEAFGSVRTSGRKRKPPSSLDVSPPRQISGWVRGALSLLQKVASYRGQGRRKGDFSAATWFLKPVDPVDAPGYYKVIKTPMDFGTVRVKLESGKYQEYSEFHSDMLLVKSNCLKYNPPGHHVRQDCEEVFRFYEAEYAKMLERWEKCHVSPAKKPRQASKTELPGSM